MSRARFAKLATIAAVFVGCGASRSKSKSAPHDHEYDACLRFARQRASVVSESYESIADFDRRCQLHLRRCVGSELHDCEQRCMQRSPTYDGAWQCIGVCRSEHWQRAIANANIPEPPLPPTATPEAAAAQHRWRFKPCYTAATLVDPASEGTTNLRVTIGADGTVASHEIVSTTMPIELADCLEHSVAGMRFLRPDGGNKTFTMQLVFTVKHENASFNPP